MMPTMLPSNVVFLVTVHGTLLFCYDCSCSIRLRM